jgi:hypothetical protein
MELIDFVVLTVCVGAVEALNTGVVRLLRRR